MCIDFGLQANGLFHYCGDSVQAFRFFGAHFIPFRFNTFSLFTRLGRQCILICNIARFNLSAKRLHFSQFIVKFFPPNAIFTRSQIALSKQLKNVLALAPFFFDGQNDGFIFSDWHKIHRGILFYGFLELTLVKIFSRLINF